MAIKINPLGEHKSETAATPVIPAPAASSPAGPIIRTLACSRLLSRFLDPVNPDFVAGISYLEAALDESYGAAIQGFIRDGLLVPYSLTPGDLSGIQSIFSIGELKGMLRQRGLKASGRKEDLARRLLASDFAGIAAAVATRGLMQCSASGTALANRYSQHHQAMESAVEEAALRVEAALREGKVEDAMLIYGAFEKERPPFHAEMPLIPCSRDEIMTTLTDTPPALLPYSAAEIREARIPAAMALLGMRHLPRFTREMKPVHTLIAYAALHRNLESWRRSGVVVGVTVQCSNDGPCEECKKLQDRVWPIETVPELPNPACTTPGGCRCVSVGRLAD
ncbi:MAG TPA: SAP domain-containing protein [Bryobacteraceae bacterium]|nr:SAP domain-containing protein [Bryobacteraceae bacterium]